MGPRGTRWTRDADPRERPGHGSGVFGALRYQRATLSVYGLDLTGNAPFAILALGFEP
jgi:hypothetical protein